MCGCPAVNCESGYFFDSIPTYCTYLLTTQHACLTQKGPADAQGLILVRVRQLAIHDPRHIFRSFPGPLFLHNFLLGLRPQSLQSQPEALTSLL